MRSTVLHPEFPAYLYIPATKFHENMVSRFLFRFLSQISHTDCQLTVQSDGADATAAKRQAILDLNTEEQDD